MTTPLPLSASEKPAFILLFGGSFDPPHRGHVELPMRVRDELERRHSAVGHGWLLFVPAARSPHKTSSPIASDADRLEMLRLATAAAPRCRIWTDEIDRAVGSGGAPSFTVDTLRRAREWMDDHALSGVHLHLLIGADQAVKFHAWRDPRDILRLATPAVMLRDEYADAASLVRAISASGYWNDSELRTWAAGVVSVGRMDVSSTRIRDALRLGRAADLRDVLDDQVAAYAAGRKLYQ